MHLKTERDAKMQSEGTCNDALLGRERCIPGAALKKNDKAEWQRRAFSSLNDGTRAAICRHKLRMKGRPQCIQMRMNRKDLIQVVAVRS